MNGPSVCQRKWNWWVLIESLPTTGQREFLAQLIFSCPPIFYLIEMWPEWPALVFWLRPNMVRWLSDDTSAWLSWFYNPQICPIPKHNHLLKQQKLWHAMMDGLKQKKVRLQWVVRLTNCWAQKSWRCSWLLARLHASVFWLLVHLQLHHQSSLQPCLPSCPHPHPHVCLTTSMHQNPLFDHIQYQSTTQIYI